MSKCSVKFRGAGEGGVFFVGLIPVSPSLVENIDRCTSQAKAVADWVNAGRLKELFRGPVTHDCLIFSWALKFWEKMPIHLMLNINFWAWVKVDIHFQK